MAAKKSASRKKTVTIEIDLETLEKLVEAAAALSEVAAAAITKSADPRAKALKKRRGKKRR